MKVSKFDVLLLNSLNEFRTGLSRLQFHDELIRRSFDWLSGRKLDNSSFGYNIKKFRVLKESSIDIELLDGDLDNIVEVVDRITRKLNSNDLRSVDIFLVGISSKVFGSSLKCVFVFGGFGKKKMKDKPKLVPNEENSDIGCILTNDQESPCELRIKPGEKKLKNLEDTLDFDDEEDDQRRTPIIPAKFAKKANTLPLKIRKTDDFDELGSFFDNDDENKEKKDGYLELLKNKNHIIGTPRPVNIHSLSNDGDSFDDLKTLRESKSPNLKDNSLKPVLSLKNGNNNLGDVSEPNFDLSQARTNDHTPKKVMNGPDNAVFLNRPKFDEDSDDFGDLKPPVNKNNEKPTLSLPKNETEEDSDDFGDLKPLVNKNNEKPTLSLPKNETEEDSDDFGDLKPPVNKNNEKPTLSLPKNEDYGEASNPMIDLPGKKDQNVNILKNDAISKNSHSNEPISNLLAFSNEYDSLIPQINQGEHQKNLTRKGMNYQSIANPKPIDVIKIIPPKIQMPQTYSNDDFHTNISVSKENSIRIVYEKINNLIKKEVEFYKRTSITDAKLTGYINHLHKQFIIAGKTIDSNDWKEYIGSMFKSVNVYSLIVNGTQFNDHDFIQVLTKRLKSSNNDNFSCVTQFLYNDISTIVVVFGELNPDMNSTNLEKPYIQFERSKINNFVIYMVNKYRSGSNLSPFSYSRDKNLISIVNSKAKEFGDNQRHIITPFPIPEYPENSGISILFSFSNSSGYYKKSKQAFNSLLEKEIMRKEILGNYSYIAVGSWDYVYAKTTYVYIALTHNKQ